MTSKEGGPQNDHRPKEQEAVMDSDLVPVGCLLSLLSLVALVWPKVERPGAFKSSLGRPVGGAPDQHEEKNDLLFQKKREYDERKRGKDKKTSPATIVLPHQDLPAETSTQVPTSCPSLSYKMPKTKSCSNIATDIVSETLSYSHDKVCQTLNSIQNTRTKSEGKRTSSHEDIVNEVTQREENTRVIIALILHLFAHKLFDKVYGLIKRHSASQQLLVPVGKAVSDTTLLKVKTGLEPSQQPWKSELVNCFTQESVRRLLQECIIYYTSSSPSSVTKLSSDITLGSEKASPARIPKAVEKKKRSAHRYGLLSKDKKTSPATIVPPPQDLPAETSTQVPTSCPSLSYKMPKTKSCSNIATDIVSETLSYSHDKVCQTLNSIQNTRTKSEGKRTSSHEDIVNEVTQREENVKGITTLSCILHLFAQAVSDVISEKKSHSTSQQLLDPAGSED
ncbi:hypothetical protein DPEC_G00280040 [Dallia pectoralis]|uniref:Uncharacterized protein n=1 Tax=Dallia pectoralis TaxID=75939 RepID=A0ACC2FMN3_DALPE|nr:hypothetical protein DPEC_G00280040 [Dallia pectoralis]